MKQRRTIFICNALEDITRTEREISSDSPAASKKIFLMAMALKSVGERAFILSMGRGKPNRNGNYFKSKVTRFNGIPIIYAPFFQMPVLSQCWSLISLPVLLYRINISRGRRAAIFYNRTPAYISSLFMCALLGYRRVLDLEDGEFFVNRGFSPYQLYIKTKRFLYTKLCNGGTILACSALSNGEDKAELCYYGAVDQCVAEISWKSSDRRKCLLGGTVSYDTGAGILIEAINFLRDHPEPWAHKLEFIITGKGDCIDIFEELATSDVFPIVRVAGRLSDQDYSEMVKSCHVGLALKPNLGELADTTFPSKVIELASSGLLVLTTDISDVRLVLGDGAIYLEDDSKDTLLRSLKWISENANSAVDIARNGISAVESRCSLQMAGSNLSRHIFAYEK